MSIDHEFSRIAGTAYGRRHIGEGGNWLKRCVCDSCKEARDAYQAPAPKSGETFEEFWERTLQQRLRVAWLTWDMNRKVA